MRNFGDDPKIRLLNRLYDKKRKVCTYCWIHDAGNPLSVLHSRWQQPPELVSRKFCHSSCRVFNAVGKRQLTMSREIWHAMTGAAEAQG